MTPKIPLSVSRQLEGLSLNAEYSLGQILPNLGQCPFLVEMFRSRDFTGDRTRIEISWLESGTRVQFGKDRDWQSDSGSHGILASLRDFKKLKDDEIAALFVHEITHLSLQNEGLGASILMTLWVPDVPPLIGN